MNDKPAGRASLTLVAARARNGVIGRAGALPWRLPGDLKHFKAYTLGKPLIMGRKTFESIGAPLPGRDTIIISRAKDFHAAGVYLAASPDQAEDIARARARILGATDIAVVGGAEIYAAFMSRADRAVISEVDLEPEGDAFLAPLDPALWRLVGVQTPPRAKDDVNFMIQTYEKRASTDLDD